MVDRCHHWTYFSLDLLKYAKLRTATRAPSAGATPWSSGGSERRRAAAATARRRAARRRRPGAAF